MNTEEKIENKKELSDDVLFFLDTDESWIEIAESYWGDYNKAVGM